ncbi:HET-domain-containing protein [Camillea tinctor]|nr:HET-domain-containing protein [Camillea tinctor]
MRLINVHTHELREFFSAAAAPPYAILSHTWTSEEMTFEAWQGTAAPSRSLVNHPHPHQHKAGFRKILSACAQARAQNENIDWLWCDTNCIDKRSSAELTEAINSMFAWYRDAAVCYAYLDDVDAGGSKEGFVRSRWFTRGWTLQELLAPEKVLFFDRNWQFMGDRAALAKMISEVTRIHIGALEDRGTIHKYSIAQRMSWAADRETTREEDVAYCLLGIFDINMPLLYGEGMKAFQRLQHEIIKTTDDQSILAWDWLGNPDEAPTSALALLPAYFRSCGSIIRDPDIGMAPYAMTNIGISIEVPMICTSVTGAILVGLNCSRQLHAKVERGYDRSRKELIVFRRSQVWIWSRSTGRDIFERAHLHSTKIFLDDSYTSSIDNSTTKIFLSTSATSTLPVPTPQSRLFGRGVSTAGFAINIGFGMLNAHILEYDKAYFPGSFSIISLKRRGHSTLSHELVSYKDVRVLLSIAWDQYGRPQNWHHTSFFDSQGEVSRQLLPEKEREEPWSINGVDNFTQLMFIHRQIKELSTKPDTVSRYDPNPFVKIEDKVLYDLLNCPHLMVRIVFNQYPGPEPINELNRKCN